MDKRNLRFNRVHAAIAGVAGYFSSTDEFTTPVEPYSNAHEMFYVNLGVYDPGSFDYLSLLAHEYQHMIHFNADRGETVWVNEGLSELATLVAGALLVACSDDPAQPCPTAARPGLAVAVGGRANTPAPAAPDRVGELIDQAVADGTGINVIRVDGQPSIACALSFRSDAANPVAVWLARRLWGLPYHLARMRLDREGGGVVAYESERVGPGPRPAGCAVRYEPTGPPAPAAVRAS